MSHSEHYGEQVHQTAVHALRTAIARQQIKLTALSAATGIPRSTLHNKLRGNSHLTVAELVRLAIALDIPAADLIAEATEVRRASRD